MYGICGACYRCRLVLTGIDRLAFRKGAIFGCLALKRLPPPLLPLYRYLHEFRKVSVLSNDCQDLVLKFPGHSIAEPLTNPIPLVDGLPFIVL